MKVIFNKLPAVEVKQLVKYGARGRKYIGEGATAKVFKYGDDKVLRIQYRDMDEYEKNDPEVHLKWARLCTKSRSPHVPKIFFIGYVTDEHGDITRLLTVTEKLDEADEAVYSDKQAWVFERFTRCCEVDFLRRNLSKAVKTSFPIQSMVALQKSIHKHSVNVNDMHSGNWMIRPSDGKLVITDPTF